MTEKKRHAHERPGSQAWQVAKRPETQRKYNTTKPLRSYRSFDEMRADYRRLGKSTLPVELLAAFPAIVFAVLAIAMMALFGWGCS